MKNNIFYILILLFVFFWAFNRDIFKQEEAFGYRLDRPITFTYPLDERQVRKLNNTLQDLWNVQNGRQNFDVISSLKSNADNGDLWFIQTGETVYIHFKGNDHVFTITPDGF